MGYWGVKNLGYGILGGKKSGIWDMGTPVSPPPINHIGIPDWELVRVRVWDA